MSVPRVQTGADPSLGNPAVVNLSAGSLWRVAALAVDVDEGGGTDPITPVLQVKEAAGGTILYEVKGFSITASSSGVRIQAATGAPRQEVTADSDQLLPLPVDMELPGGAQLMVTTEGAGTPNFTAPVALCGARDDPEN